MAFGDHIKIQSNINHCFECVCVCVIMLQDHVLHPFHNKYCKVIIHNKLNFWTHECPFLFKLKSQTNKNERELATKTKNKNKKTKKQKQNFITKTMFIIMFS